MSENGESFFPLSDSLSLMRLNEASSELYQALRARDRRFDGRFFVGVKTTGIYCRPICPSRTPLRKNISFFTSAAAAEQNGFRPCKRCRPETSPGSPAWSGSLSVIRRALRMMEVPEQMADGIPGLAERLGIGERQLRRLFEKNLGASPQGVYRVLRLDFARRLVDDTDLSITEIAMAAGFYSLRRLNDDFKLRFGTSPREIRKTKRSGSRRTSSSSAGALTLRLQYAGSIDWDWLLGFFRTRAIPGVEFVGERSYSRSFVLDGHQGQLRLVPEPMSSTVLLNVAGVPSSCLMEVSFRVRSLLDLDADATRIEEHLLNRPELKGWVRRFPGTRIPGCWDAEELAVRAILGQQVSVSGARTLAARVVGVAGEKLSKPEERFPGLTHLFPRMKDLMKADLSGLGITSARIRAIRGLAQAVIDGSLRLNRSEPTSKVREKLLQVPGVGPWTADYICLRALGDPDVFLEGDLVIRRALKEMNLLNEFSAWSPWRGYVVFLLWREAARRASIQSKKRTKK